jgi:hypothetical protein
METWEHLDPNKSEMKKESCPRYTLGCHGVFGTMGIDSTEVYLSIPGEQMTTLCQFQELWKKRGKPPF